MNENTVLDFVELRVSSPGSSRCDLSISADGKTEKLACGFWKTFLSHVRAAAEGLDVNVPQTVVRLEGPEASNGTRMPWFTKRTVERFVQFVSAPEVLERVKAIEDELAQLEQVRSIQAKGLIQDDSAMGVHATIITAGKLNHNAVTCEAGDSKGELLRAMELRLAALQQEQDMAFSRATAAGFDDDSVKDLLALSDYFGADRLRVACNCFVELYKRCQRAGLTSLHCCSSAEISHWKTLPVKELEAGFRVGASHVIVSHDLRGGGAHVRAVEAGAPMRTSPPERTPVDIDSVSLMRGSQLHGHVSKGLPQRASPRRRSASPLKRVQVVRFGSRLSGSSVVGSINYSGHGRTSKNTMDTSSSESEDNAKSSTANEPGYWSSPAAARRVSVQAAINLFENKQQKDVNGAQASHRLMTKDDPLVESRQHEVMESSALNVESRQHEAIDRGLPKRASAQGALDMDGRPWMEQIARKSPCRHQDLAPDSVTAYLSSQVDMSNAQSSLKSIFEDGACVDKSSASDEESIFLADASSLTNSAECPAVSDEISSRNEGRLYEQYMKLRDAKMRDEQQSKRAEREAKLRVMAETLILSKAEMDAQNARLHGDRFHTQARAAKLVAFKANLGDIQIFQESSVVGLDTILACTPKDRTFSDSSLPSPPSTPRAVREQAPTPKVHKVKKAAYASQKGSSTPRSSPRAASISTRSTPSGTASSHLSPVSSRLVDNPLACPVPFFSDLKKNGKPSPGKSPGSTRDSSKINGTLGDPSAMEYDGTTPAHNSAHSKNAKLDKKIRGGSQLSHSGLAISAEAEVSGVVNAPREAKNRAPVPSRVRRSAVAPIQEARPFLRKGAGIGPGAGRGFMKMKADVTLKSPDRDAPATPQKNSDEEAPRNILDGDTMDIALKGLLCSSSEMDEEAETTSIFFTCEHGGSMEHLRHEPYTLASTSEHASVVQQPSRVEILKHGGDASASLSELLFDGAGQVLHSCSGAHGSASFRATQHLDELIMTRFSPTKPAVLATSSVKRLGATVPHVCSTSSGVTLVESPVGRPSSWSSSQVQYASETDVTLAQKKCKGPSEKPVVVVVPPKEPVKGLRHLLKFGRRSRAAALEVLVGDGVSASITSEGDDDSDDVTQILSEHDLPRKGGQLQERLLKKFGDGVLAGDPGTLRLDQSSQSSIPVPPSKPSSKVLYRLKGPRSFFFSLSTFRSRVREGKSR